MNTVVDLPHFNNIQIETIPSTLEKMLAEYTAALEKLLSQSTYTWDNLMAPLEFLQNDLNRFWSTVNHLHGVKNAPALRDSYNACLPLLTEFGTKLAHNLQLFNAVNSIFENAALWNTFDLAQKKVIENQLRDFRLAGIHLTPEQKKNYLALATRLSQLTSRFEENVLDATQAWTYHTQKKEELQGLPEHALGMALQAATNKGLSGWLFTLEQPSYLAVMTYADHRALREKMYEAYVTRASDQGPNAGKWDNSHIMLDILDVRHQKAQLLGFQDYTELAFSTKMAKNAKEVLDFLQDLVTASKPRALAEFKELENFAREQGHLQPLEPWDVAYFSEKLQKHYYDIAQEDLRPYFPEPRVFSGLFAILKKLYQISIKERLEFEKWHKDVRCFELYDEKNERLALVITDLYARSNKRGGAWMDECRVRMRLQNGNLQLPVAFLTCNFNEPLGTEPALFTHDDVITLFHEFGHCLQHMLTKMEYSEVSGINGIPWDAVELASQFFENWCWQKESLDLLTQHYQTGEALPDVLFQKAWRAKNFQSAMQMLRQIEFAVFDLRIHQDYHPNDAAQIQKTLDDVRANLAVVPFVRYNRFQHSFGHIFAGGYAAGYYSYKWAEVMACDAFSLFEERGLFDTLASSQFKHYILEKGGSEDAMELFVKFRGRKPQVAALLKHVGIL